MEGGRGMEVSSGDIRHCVEQARELSEHYRQLVLNGNASRKSIDQLYEIIKTYLQKVVTVKDVNVPRNTIAALVLVMEDGSYKVGLLSGMPDEERRFAYCKELFHVVLDVVECRNMKIFGHIEEVVATFPVRDSKPKRSAVAEKLAEIAAMEFMFPYTDRLTVLSGANGNPDFTACAKRYGIPRELAELYCSDPWMDFLGEF
jgi:Zn-dependent peptidase ImmA (M78 family)